MSCPVHFDAKNKIWRNPPIEDDFSPDQSLGQLILDRLNEIDPDHIIEINHENGNKWTASDIRRLSIRCAENFLDLGAKQGDVVMFFSSLNSYTTPTIFGCYLIGAIVHPVDVNCNEDDLEFSCRSVDPKIILCDGNVYDKVIAITNKLDSPNLKHILSFHSREDRRTVPDIIMKYVDPKKNNFDPFKTDNPRDTIAVLMSSSGSTGRPKVSMLSHSLIIHAIQNWWATQQSDIVYCASHLRWISQIITMIQMAVYGFCRVTSSEQPSAELTAKIIQTHKVTHLFAIPTLILDMLDYASANDKYIKTLKVFLTGAEVIPTSFSGRVKNILPKCKIIKIYTMTELAGPLASTENLKRYDGNGGQIMPGVNIKICDENMRPLGHNDRGQICIKTEFLFSGYWRGERTTEEAFDTDDWFITGDFGYVDDKNMLHVSDKFADVIVCDGKMIFPNAIEEILKGHPYISTAVIIGIPHREKGQIPGAFIKLKNDSTTSRNEDIKNELLSYLSTQIEHDQMPVGGMYFVDKFPLTYNDKVCRSIFKKLVAENEKFVEEKVV